MLQSMNFFILLAAFGLFSGDAYAQSSHGGSGRDGAVSSRSQRGGSGDERSGDGVSHSGPDLSGPSIGPAVEARSSFNQIRDLTERCLYQMLVKLWEVQFNRDFLTAAKASVSYTLQSRGGMEGGGVPSAPATEDSIRKSCLRVSYSPNSCEVDAVLGTSPTGKNIELKFSRCEAKPALVSVYVPPSPNFPGAPDFVDFDTAQFIAFYAINAQKVDRSFFDEYGRFLQLKADIPIDITLYVPANTDGTLLNHDSQVASTKLFLDLQGFTQCMRQNL